MYRLAGFCLRHPLVMARALASTAWYVVWGYPINVKRSKARITYSGDLEDPRSTAQGDTW